MFHTLQKPNLGFGFLFRGVFGVLLARVGIHYLVRAVIILRYPVGHSQTPLPPDWRYAIPPFARPVHFAQQP